MLRHPWGERASRTEDVTLRQPEHVEWPEKEEETVRKWLLLVLPMLALFGVQTQAQTTTPIQTGTWATLTDTTYYSATDGSFSIRIYGDYLQSAADYPSETNNWCYAGIASGTKTSDVFDLTWQCAADGHNVLVHLAGYIQRVRGGRTGWRTMYVVTSGEKTVQ